MNSLKSFAEFKPQEARFSWRSPSNIAFVKYWGKKGYQLPANPSLSMTLKECYTQTSVKFSPSESMSVVVNLDGKQNEGFAEKILKFLKNLEGDLPWIKNLSLVIDTKNTFPHGTGIASSASGMSALCLCLSQYLDSKIDEEFYKRASFLSRLASGSACRSVYGGFSTWGDESDYFASPVEVHKDLAHLHDSVVIVSSKEKSVTSTAGHDRMGEHAFALSRYEQAKKNFLYMKDAMVRGDIHKMGEILESEAFSLHAMMMTAPQSFTLLRPQSLMAIELVREFRKDSGLPLYFTLDAGPNLHLIYPDEGLHKIRTFIEHELAPLSEKIIHDQRGEGPEIC